MKRCSPRRWALLVAGGAPRAERPRFCRSRPSTSARQREAAAGVEDAVCLRARQVHASAPRAEAGRRPTRMSCASVVSTRSDDDEGAERGSVLAAHLDGQIRHR